MNKSELIAALAEKEQLTEKSAADIVDLIFTTFTETLKEGGRVEIRGFGSFAVRDYQSYTGRNPRTGVSITVAPKKLPFFKASKKLKERVDSQK